MIFFRILSWFTGHLAQLDAKRKSIWLLKFPKKILHDFLLYVTRVYKLFWKYFLRVCFWNLLWSLSLFFINYPDISAFLTIFDCLTWLEDTWHLYFKVWMFLVDTISRHGRSKMSFQITIPMYVLKCEHSIWCCHALSWSICAMAKENTVTHSQQPPCGGRRVSQSGLLY